MHKVSNWRISAIPEGCRRDEEIWTLGARTRAAGKMGTPFGSFSSLRRLRQEYGTFAARARVERSNHPPSPLVNSASPAAAGEQHRVADGRFATTLAIARVFAWVRADPDEQRVTSCATRCDRPVERERDVAAAQAHRAARSADAAQRRRG